MSARRTIKRGFALAMAGGVIASGPAVAHGLGFGHKPSRNLSAAWEGEQVRNAENAAGSHAGVLRWKAAAKHKRKAEAKRKAAAERKAEAKRMAAAERKLKQQHAARSAVRGGTPAQDRALGMQLCSAMGWSASQCSDLGKLWQKESGWNHKAQNSSSGAYGIPQALPGSKMGSVGADWRTNPATQIKWGLNYIKARYGNPSNAWAHSVSSGWY